jgi:hypothetical protein
MKHTSLKKLQMYYKIEQLYKIALQSNEAHITDDQIVLYQIYQTYAPGFCCIYTH